MYVVMLPEDLVPTKISNDANNQAPPPQEFAAPTSAQNQNLAEKGENIPTAH